MSPVPAVLPSAASAAGSTPEPTAGTGHVPDDLTDPGSWVTWFVGTPLKIMLIVVIGGIVLVLVRRSIRGVTNHIAEGTPLLQRGVMRPIGETGVGSVLLKADPLASARRAQRARTIDSVLRSSATILIGSTIVFMVLAALGVNIAPFIASAGIIGVALGFGAQSLVKDFLTGTFMLLEDQYGVGDVVDVGPATGTVEAVTLRVTKIRDADGTLWYVPNGSMLRVGNKTQGWATAVVEIDVDYFADLDEVRALLAEAGARVARDPQVGHYLQGEPAITGIERLAADAVSLRLKVTTSPAMQWEVARALRVAARDELEKAGVPLAGQRDLLAAHRAAVAATDGHAGSPEHDETVEPPPPSEQDGHRPADDGTTVVRDPHDTPLDDVVNQQDARRASPPTP
ncbi:mechanosensitive ion channel family protein [Cellulomonas sp. URHB0016]